MTPLATVSPRERPPATPTLHVRALPVTILRNKALAALPARAFFTATGTSVESCLAEIDAILSAMKSSCCNGLRPDIEKRGIIPQPEGVVQ